MSRFVLALVLAPSIAFAQSAQITSYGTDLPVFSFTVKQKIIEYHYACVPDGAIDLEIATTTDIWNFHVWAVEPSRLCNNEQIKDVTLQFLVSEEEQIAVVRPSDADGASACVATTDGEWTVFLCDSLVNNESLTELEIDF